MRLWRPVGPQELEKIRDAGMRAFPPRLPEQPIFYPVLSFAYAEKIARDWNSTRRDHDYLGHVTAFDLTDGFACRYEPQPAGGTDYMELWVPAEDLATLNDNLTGKIAAAATYRKGQRVS